MSDPSLHQRLYRLVGDRFQFRGELWTLIDILGEDDALVLARQSDSHHPVQQNLYGAPNRRARELLTLPLSGDANGGDGYSAEVLDLLAGRVNTGPTRTPAP